MSRIPGEIVYQVSVYKGVNEREALDQFVLAVVLFYMALSANNQKYFWCTDCKKKSSFHLSVNKLTVSQCPYPARVSIRWPVYAAVLNPTNDQRPN